MFDAKRRQTKGSIEGFYASKDDPWGYFGSEDDKLRKQVLLSELGRHELASALDIGCGNGFITESIPAESVLGVDLSELAVNEARRRSSAVHVQYQAGSLFDLPSMGLEKFSAVIITGVLYEQYIGRSLPLVYRLVDEVLLDGGLLFSVHIESWYAARFPYARVREMRYRYRNYTHLLEVYRK